MAAARHASQAAERDAWWRRALGGRDRQQLQPVNALPSTDNLVEMFLRRQRVQNALWQGDPNRHGAVFACKDLIARMVSTLPVHEYTRDAEGRLVRSDRQPSILEEPEADVDITEWLYAQIFGGLLTPGMAFGYVSQVNPDGSAATVVALDSADVELLPRRNRLDPARWSVFGQVEAPWPLGRLWIARGYPMPGTPIGLSPLGLARLSVGIGLSARQYAADWFQQGHVPPGTLEHPDKQPKEVRTEVQRQWADDTAESREVRVLTGGWTFKPQRVSAEESQFLETINANAADVCRFFGVSPEDIGASSGSGSVTYANVEQRQLQLLVRTVGPWVVRLERRLSRLVPVGREVRFTLDGLLRTDARTRASIINDEIRAGRLSVNEARALEDRPGIGQDGDRFLWPPLRQQLTLDELNAGADQLAPSPGLGGV